MHNLLIILAAAVTVSIFSDANADLAAVASAVRTRFASECTGSYSYVGANDLGAYANAQCSAQHGNYSNCTCTARTVSFEHAGVVISGESSKPCLYATASDSLTDTAREEYLWMYAGFNDGTHTSYPAHRYMTTTSSGDYCKVPTSTSTYDPRQRMWYMNAIAGPINIVFIIDQSGSMNMNGINRLEAVQQVVEQLINGLTPATRAGIVSFGGGATIRSALFETDTDSGKPALIDAVWSIMSIGSTNFQEGFAKAAEVMYATDAASDCQNVFVFLSDGVPDAGQGAEVADVVQDGDIVYSIAMGDDAGRTIMEEIACRHGGDFIFIEDDDSQDVMSASWQGSTMCSGRVCSARESCGLSSTLTQRLVLMLSPPR